jgi:hypothetical protein
MCLKPEGKMTEEEIVTQLAWWANVACEEMGLRKWDDNEERPKTIEDAFNNIKELVGKWNDYRRNNHP